MKDWDVVRTFLAVQRAGSTLGAAARLGQSQPTVARRIQALEAMLGVSLFHRRNKGYLLTADGEALIADAVAMEEMAARFAAHAAAIQRRSSGTVKLTCGEMLAHHHLAALLADFARAHPGIPVELLVSEEYLDVAAGEADIAIRGAEAGRGPGIGQDLVARRLLNLPWAVYASRSYVQVHGTPASLADMAEHSIVGADGALAELAVARWLEEQAPNARVVGRANSMAASVAQLCAGAGLGVVSAGFLDQRDDIVRCFDLPSDMDAEVWLVTSEQARAQPHVRILLDFLVSYVAVRQSRLQARIMAAIGSAAVT